MRPFQTAGAAALLALACQREELALHPSWDAGQRDVDLQEAWPRVFLLEHHARQDLATWARGRAIEATEALRRGDAATAGEAAAEADLYLRLAEGEARRADKLAQASFELEAQRHLQSALRRLEEGPPANALQALNAAVRKIDTALEQIRSSVVPGPTDPP